MPFAKKNMLFSLKYGFHTSRRLSRAVAWGLSALLLHTSAPALAQDQKVLDPEPAFAAEQWGAREARYRNLRLTLLPAEVPDLPAPPAPGSPEAMKEIEDVRRIQADPDNEARLQNMLEETSRPVGALLQERRVLPARRSAPTLWKLMELINADITTAALRSADTFDRLAPHRVSDEIVTRVGPATSPAFPSLKFAQLGTALQFLGQLAPECADDYDLMLADLAIDLQYAGLHRSTDLQAASLLSTWYLGSLSSTTALRDDMIRAQTELSIYQRMAGCPLPRE